MKIVHHSVAAAFILCCSLACSAQLTSVGDGGLGPAKAPHLTAEMVTLAPQIAAGGQLQAGLTFSLEDKWHVYWTNAGFAGYPPTIAWTLPKGITADPIQFPIPDRLPYATAMDYGYEDHVTYPFVLHADSSVKPGPVHLDAQVSWLVCTNGLCLPGKGHLGLNLNVVAGPVAAPAAVGPIGEALAHLPKPLPAGTKIAVNVGDKDFIVTLITGKSEPDAELYPYDGSQIADADDQTVQAQPDGIRLWAVKSSDLKSTPATFHGLFKLNDNVAYEFTAPVVAGDIPEPVAPPSASLTDILEAVGLAFLGGILLNLMPCVFPVLFLKALALVNSSSEERGRLRRHGFVYALGIVVSFWAVVGVLLGLRAAGHSLGWGFQLQSPTFVAVLASFLFFFALSLAGQFDLGLSLTSVGGDLAKKQGYAGSFFTGVLATVVATPCTAPLMGAAVGFALAQPAGITFLVFTAMALGLALPYVMLSAQPAWVNLLPKPGPWMEVLKQLTSLFLFGAAGWLAWVYGGLGSDGTDRMALLLACFLLLAVAGWALGRWPAQWKGAIAAILLILAGLTVPLYPQKASTLNWQPYTPQALGDARASGKPVFIDFTAAWCLSCQVNEKLVLHTSDVEKALTGNNYILIKADWTAYDANITAALASVNRSGVPTYVIYPAGANSTADVLPELLTKSAVLAAIQLEIPRSLSLYALRRVSLRSPAYAAPGVSRGLRWWDGSSGGRAETLAGNPCLRLFPLRHGRTGSRGHSQAPSSAW